MIIDEILELCNDKTITLDEWQLIHNSTQEFKITVNPNQRGGSNVIMQRVIKNGKNVIGQPFYNFQTDKRIII